MNREDIAEEHRKYLDMSDNPQRVSNTSIFAMLSDGLIDLKVSLAKVETRQEQTAKDIKNMDCKLDGVTEKMNGRIKIVEDDFIEHCIHEASDTGKIDERFKWQEKMQKVLVFLLLSILGFLLVVFGIPIPLP